MTNDPVGAVLEHVGKECSLRWFPLVWKAPSSEYVKPEDWWIAVNCPQGYLTAREAFQAALEYLHG